ncbi:MAG: multifunctional oxoglutarate decarboxylase/oxoglutarate dehydrogenase thiamine pyrophosphate-binding subunit/dihydrolipoyllysine-residue succinyltransferase subunit, partial [Pseudonocardiaceae bacterium]
SQGPFEASPATGVEEATLDRIVDVVHEPPPGFAIHPKLAKQLATRLHVYADGQVDWALAETLAFGSLLLEGTDVRLSGQDTRRGTFSQRHSVLVDYDTGREWTALHHLGTGSVPERTGRQAKFWAYDSLLSEYAALGFEYGYSVVHRDALVLWEAQFGDFANGAQIIIDQFLTAAEDKWGQSSGLVLLLPHGFEGQGPEHSSARLERYLQSCAEDNLQVANCTTPANYFHILRRQLKRDIRKPLILMTPKSLLRHKRAVSSLDSMAIGTSFHRLLADGAEKPGEHKVRLVSDNKIRRVLLCTGKVYYDLFEERERREIDDVYLLRVEQLYPMPLKALVSELQRFGNAQIAWCQEEPKNMGPWTFVMPDIEAVMDGLG